MAVTSNSASSIYCRLTLSSTALGSTVSVMVPPASLVSSGIVTASLVSHCATVRAVLIGKFVTFVPFCPEMEIGLGSPRESIRLASTPEGVRLVAPQSGRDLTDDFSRSVFTPEEQELAAQSGESQTTLMRFWCAKEALTKALGTGIRYNPSDLRVRAWEPLAGRLELELVAV